MELIDTVHAHITSVTGLLFQIQGAEPTKELWDTAKRELTKVSRKQDDIFYEIVMPCGQSMTLATPEDIMNLPIEDIPCSCGDKSHWFVKFSTYYGSKFN